MLDHCFPLPGLLGQDDISLRVTVQKLRHSPLATIVGGLTFKLVLRLDKIAGQFLAFGQALGKLLLKIGRLVIDV